MAQHFFEHIKGTKKKEKEKEKERANGNKFQISKHKWECLLLVLSMARPAFTASFFSCDTFKKQKAYLHLHLNPVSSFFFPWIKWKPKECMQRSKQRQTPPLFFIFIMWFCRCSLYQTTTRSRLFERDKTRGRAKHDWDLLLDAASRDSRLAVQSKLDQTSPQSKWNRARPRFCLILHLNFCNTKHSREEARIEWG